MADMSQLDRPLQLNRRYLLVAGLLVLALYVLVPQLGDFKSSWHLLRHPAAGWTTTAVGLTALTYLAGASTYYWLAFKPLRYAQVVLVQLAAMFINRLLPGGIGAVGANYAYLRRPRHSGVQAGSMVAINNLLGIVGHGLVLLGAVAIFAGRTTVEPVHGHGFGLGLKIFGTVVAAIIVLGLLFGGSKLKVKLRDVYHQLLTYRQRQWHLAAALVSSMALTLSNVLCLACCATALGVHLSFLVIMLIFSFGLGTGTATPTPGGLGGFEAGLAAGFVAYHVAGPAALAIALLYRLVSYWLPLLAGAPAFIICQKQSLFSSAKY